MRKRPLSPAGKGGEHYWSFKTKRLAKHQWLTPVILTTQEAEIRRIKV
jgi:hypothetical protein